MRPQKEHEVAKCCLGVGFYNRDPLPPNTSHLVFIFSFMTS